jgi:hypothetical protein
VFISWSASSNEPETIVAERRPVTITSTGERREGSERFRSSIKGVKAIGDVITVEKARGGVVDVSVDSTAPSSNVNETVRTEGSSHVRDRLGELCVRDGPRELVIVVAMGGNGEKGQKGERKDFHGDFVERNNLKV